MIRHAIDPSLCPGEPLLESLEDGFSPPADARAEEPQDSRSSPPGEVTLSPQSPF